ncbi:MULTISPECIES: nucleotidyltransferase family protein [unclassified Anaeromyxobacter]|uniref:nucleotidyltransferase family protein n=1 Tax=unclassified Anaeromyxobacter TaxID=2620896 RepID=UPI001F5634C2|nr:MULTISPECIES: nucleotidyltransferase family protein [unclassified Anaeromyxobacter]
MGDVVGMVLCAGLGTRLRPLTARVAKPGVPVCGVPLVRWSLALLAGAGVRRAVVNVHHLPDGMAAAAGEAARALGMALAVSREPVIAGTGGALREARAHLAGADAIVLVNGDVLFDVDVAAALAEHRASGALATMVLLPMPAGARYASVETDAGGAVRRIAGAFGPGGEGLAPWHFSGVHVLSPALLDRVPAAPFERDINRHVYPPLMASGAVRGRVVAGYWNDLGTPARYLEATLDVLAGRVPLARFPGADPFSGTREVAPGVHAAAGARLDPRARLAGPTLVCAGAAVGAGAEVGPRAVIGPGASVPGGATVREAIVWEGTELAPGERLEGAIAAGKDRVGARE